MKIFFTLLVLFFSLPVLSDYIKLNCHEINAVGFEGDDNYKKYQTYRQDDFEMFINTNLLSVKAEGISFESETRHYETMKSLLSCAHLGYSLFINLDTYKYTSARGYGFSVGKTDDILIAYGTCYKNR